VEALLRYRRGFRAISARDRALKAYDDWTTIARGMAEDIQPTGPDPAAARSRLPFMARTIKDNLDNPTLMMDLELIQDRSLPHDFLGELDLLV
jgi:hypothetical protein